jgi:hypothetical protein
MWLTERERLTSTGKKYKPNPKPRWLDEEIPALDYAAQWLKTHPRGLVWVTHVFFGRKLEELTGVPLFGAGQGENGRPMIEDYAGRGPAIVTVGANAEGRNLQYGWSDNLVLTPPSTGREWEQLLGRTHREGQTAKVVTAEVLLIGEPYVNAEGAEQLAESAAAWEHALEDSGYLSSVWSFKHKLEQYKG